MIDNTQKQINEVCDSIKNFLLTKNQKYGNSALSPLNIFVKSHGDQTHNNIEQRLDDKIARIKNSDILRKNDVVDLIGYLILLCIKNDWTDFYDLID